RSRAEQAEASAAQALAAEGETIESLRAELASAHEGLSSAHEGLSSAHEELSAAHEELDRARAAALELPTNEVLEAERERATQAGLAAEQARTEAAANLAALEFERQTVAELRAELDAAREE